MDVAPSFRSPLRAPHPFPARMAPEIALNECERLPVGSLIADPMCGSGTVLRAAAVHGHRAVGGDLDPLAVLMARVWASGVHPGDLVGAADDLIGHARKLGAGVRLPWIDDDAETAAFVDYWFGRRQQDELRPIAALLSDRSDGPAEAMRLALSRIIVTKDRGASLARDVSHSRPHRVAMTSDFAVYAAFRRSAQVVGDLLTPAIPSDVQVVRGDARRLDHIPSSTVDLTVTSPPYLNGIDYLRGHRLSLVWLGYRLADLRTARAEQVGAERGSVEAESLAIGRSVVEPITPDLVSLPARQLRIVERYGADLHSVLSEIARISRPSANVVIVVGDTTSRGVLVRNASLVRSAAAMLPLAFDSEVSRDLPESRRYLPPPGPFSEDRLGRRLRTESVLRFHRLP